MKQELIAEAKRARNRRYLRKLRLIGVLSVADGLLLIRPRDLAVGEATFIWGVGAVLIGVGIGVLFVLLLLHDQFET